MILWSHPSQTQPASSSKKHLSGFGRTTLSKNINSIFFIFFPHLIEATGIAQEMGTRRPKQKVLIEQFRKSYDFAEYRQDLKKYRIWNKTNGIQTLLLENPIRNYRVPDSAGRKFFNLKKLLRDEGSFLIRGKLQSQGRGIYEIEVSSRGLSGTLYIHDDDFAIVKGALDFNPFQLYLTDTSRLAKELRESVFVSGKIYSLKFIYQEVDGVYYPSFLELMVPNSLRKGAGLMADWQHTLGFQTSTLVVTEIQTKKGQIVKIRKRDALDKELPLIDLSKIYNAPFWDSYSMLKHTPLEARVVQDLEFSIGLGRQFQGNSVSDSTAH